MTFNTSGTIVEKLQRSATPFIKVVYKSAIPYIMKMSKWFLSVLVGLFQFCLNFARNLLDL
nr:hypothetical protein MtrDRAFT_AC157504g26v2 [Medicago truncatula]